MGLLTCCTQYSLIDSVEAGAQAHVIDAGRVSDVIYVRYYGRDVKQMSESRLFMCAPLRLGSTLPANDRNCLRESFRRCFGCYIGVRLNIFVVVFNDIRYDFFETSERRRTLESDHCSQISFVQKNSTRTSHNVSLNVSLNVTVKQQHDV